MERTLKRLSPGILLAVGAVLATGLAIVVSKALDFDVDFDLDWDDPPA